MDTLNVRREVPGSDVRPDVRPEAKQRLDVAFDVAMTEHFLENGREAWIDEVSILEPAPEAEHSPAGSVTESLTAEGEPRIEPSTTDPARPIDSDPLHLNEDVAQPVRGILYEGEKYDIKRTGDLRTIFDKTGKVVFQYSLDDNTGVTLHYQMARGHRKVFWDAYQGIQGKDIAAIVKDPTGVKPVELLGGLAPKGAHAISTAHQILGRGGRVSNGERYTFKRIGDYTYEVHRRDSSLAPKDQLVAASSRNGIVAGPLTSQEINHFYEAYQTLKSQALEKRKPTLKSHSHER